ncbi:MAG TPA: ABC transporter permease, partial [Acidobacteriota bacterium]|nr:ABC transporter permease [Acidobacteriota bacterium]
MTKNLYSIGEAFSQAFTSIRSNKLRAFLTILGIVIGVMAVIGMVAVIQGLNSSMMETLQSMGPDLIQFQREDAVTFHRPTREQRFRPPLKYEDAKAIRAFCPAMKAVSPEAYYYDVTLKYKNEKARGVNFGGVETTFAECNNTFVGSGRFLTESDIAHATSVVVLGHSIAEALFAGGVDPVGKTVNANGYKFKVVGVFAKKGGSFMGGSGDEYATIP